MSLLRLAVAPRLHLALVLIETFLLLPQHLLEPLPVVAAGCRAPLPVVAALALIAAEVVHAEAERTVAVTARCHVPFCRLAIPNLILEAKKSWRDEGDAASQFAVHMHE